MGAEAAAVRWAGRELRPCGTIAAYRRHQRHGEKPCPDCCAAYNKARNERPGTGGDQLQYRGGWKRSPGGVMIPVPA